MTDPRTFRWNAVLVAAFLTIASGILLGEPTILLLSIPLAVFAVYSHLPRTRELTLEVDRTIAPARATHGEAVEVTVTLRNTGTRSLPNVWFADGVPPMLEVRDGTARHAASIGAGTETSISYTIVAKHGIHCFDPSTVVLRDASGRVIDQTTIVTDTELACRSPVRTLPFDRPARWHTGSTASIDGERGVEFSRVRTYHPGDPPGRIDWNRYARGGELTTLESREDRSRRAILCLDARDRCYRSSAPNEPHAVSYGRTAAIELLDAIESQGDAVGLVVVGPDHDNRWIAPETGSFHIESIRRALEDPETVPVEPPTESVPGVDGSFRVRPHLEGIDREVSIVIISPVLDEAPATTARTLRFGGHPVTLLSPDVTRASSVGTALARLQRENRLHRCRRADVSVVDWTPGTSLQTAIERGGFDA